MAEIQLDLPDFIDFNCWRFETAPSLESLQNRATFLKLDKETKQAYTLVEGALDRMRGSYKKRLDELKGVTI